MKHAIHGSTMYRWKTGGVEVVVKTRLRGTGGAGVPERVESEALTPLLYGPADGKVFDVRRALAARTAIGVPPPKDVAAQIKRWKKLRK
jgi:hypothetical protein